jgi:hypothetical protein
MCSRLPNASALYCMLCMKTRALPAACSCCAMQFLRFLILLSNMIPISLYVSLEVVKVFQCTLLLNSDRQMYHRDTDTPFVCRTTTLNEELGQVCGLFGQGSSDCVQQCMHSRRCRCASSWPPPHPTRTRYQRRITSLE